jgi:adenosylmethionine-8-amino-7-oxononanoate aminotransferase
MVYGRRAHPPGVRDRYAVVKSTYKSSSAILYRDLRREYKTITRASGVYLFDSDGKQYLDAVGGAAVNIIGHGVREVLASLADEASSTSFVYSAFYTHPWQEELGALLRELAPFPGGRVYFCSGGSEANETAIKLARQYHLERGNSAKWKVISRWASYHGNTMATLGVSGRTSWRQQYDPYFMDSPHIVPSFCYRCPYEQEFPSCGIRCANDLERTILLEGADTVAAFIAEPVSGTSLVGATPVPGYYERVREICDTFDVLFIADEVLSGYGRTGRPFSIEYWNATPDILVAGKGIGSGYVPLAACIATERVVEPILSGSGRFVHSFTFGGMPLPCHVGVKVFEYVKEHDLFRRAAEQGDYLHGCLRQLADRCPYIGDVRGLGLLAGVEIVADRATKRPFEQTALIAERVVSEAENRGVLLREGSPAANNGRGGDQIQITPPYTITREEVDRIVDVLGSAIEGVTATL